MEDNETKMQVPNPGFWASLKAVLSPLPPPLIIGICIGFDEDDDMPNKDST